MSDDTTRDSLTWADVALHNEITFPVADMGHGEHVATLRISQEVESMDMLRAVMKEAAQATSDHFTVEVVFGSKVPPPVLITLDELADCLRIQLKDAKDLVKFGWLTPIHYRGTDKWTERYATVEVAMEYGHWSGWEVRFLWSEVVALAEWAKDHHHLPSYAAQKPRRVEGAENWKDRWHPPSFSIAALTRKIVREAKDEKTGRNLYLATKEIHRLVQEQVGWKKVSYATVQDALHQSHKKGEMKRKQYKSTYRNHKGAAWRWATEKERKLFTFETPGYHEPPQDDDAPYEPPEGLHRVG